jgi:Transcriptional Coactivator p15 (PC4)
LATGEGKCPSAGKGAKDMSDIIFELPKDSRETIRFSLAEYKGHRFVDLRIFFNDDGKDPAPTKKRLACPQASGKPISICPQCQGKVFIKTSSGKRYCYHCLFGIKDEIGICSTSSDEVDWILEDAVERARERSAIFEYDAGIERKQADETARVLCIQPAIEELLQRGLITIEGG